MLAMMLVGVVLIPVRASQLYVRLSERRATAGPLPTRRRPFVIVSGRLSDVRGFNDFFSSVLTQVCVFVLEFAGCNVRACGGSCRRQQAAEQVTYSHTRTHHTHCRRAKRAQSAGGGCRSCA